MHDDDAGPTMQAAEALVERIRPLLAGQPPDVIGAALADIVSVFFASHHPILRHEAMAMWMDCMRDLIPVNERHIFKHGKPQGWEAQ